MINPPTCTTDIRLRNKKKNGKMGPKAKVKIEGGK